MTIESECCREDTQAWEPCPPFQELQAENEMLRKTLKLARDRIAYYGFISDRRHFDHDQAEIMPKLEAALQRS